MPAEGQGVRRQLNCPWWGAHSRSTASPAFTDTEHSPFLPCLKQFIFFFPVPALLCPVPDILFPVPASKTSYALRSQQCQVPPGWRSVFYTRLLQKELITLEISLQKPLLNPPGGGSPPAGPPGCCPLPWPCRPGAMPRVPWLSTAVLAAARRYGMVTQSCSRTQRCLLVKSELFR